MHRFVRLFVVVGVLLIGACGNDDSSSQADRESSTTASAGRVASTSSPETTGSSTTSVAEVGGLAGADSLVKSVVGRTYGEVRADGVTAHQQSDFGKSGSWTLFTVEKDGSWYAFTTVNQREAGDAGTLSDSSKVVTGELLKPLPDNDWYGVEGVVRDGRELHGVMMQGRGYERERDGTFPVRAAWRVNLQTLALEASSTAGLDIVESCG